MSAFIIRDCRVGGIRTLHHTDLGRGGEEPFLDVWDLERVVESRG